MSAWIQSHKNGVLIHIHAQPGASKTQISGLHGEPPRLKIRIAAPAVENKANEELLAFLKKKLGVTKSDLEIVRGETSKQKDVFCARLSLEAVQEILLNNPH